LSLSGENTFEGGVNLESTTGSAVQIGSYDGLGTGTLTANQVIGGGGLLAGQTLDGAAADKNGNTNPLGVTNPINIVTGKYFNVSGGKLISDNGFNENFLNGPVTLNTTLTCEVFFKLTCSHTISGVGGLTKNQGGPMILSGTICYTGDTTVNAGTLQVTGSSIVDTGKLVINGGKVKPVGTETVGSLFFGAAEQGPGTYGSTSSAATNQDDTRFSGSGMILVAANSSAVLRPPSKGSPKSSPRRPR